MSPHGGKPTITVRGLTEVSHLMMSVIAGRAGENAPVKWAHVSDLVDPTPWLGPGDLLLIHGFGMPADHEAQRAYVERLASHELSGIVLARELCAPLGEPFFAQAERNGFPVVEIAAWIAYADVVRTVAVANGEHAHQRLLMHSRVLDAIRATTAESLDVAMLVQRLEQLTGYSLYLATDDGTPIFDDIPVPEPEHLHAALSAERSSSAIPGGFVVEIPLRGFPPAHLVAIDREERAGSGLVAIQYTAAVIAMELRGRRRSALQRAHSASELLRDLLTESAPSASLDARIQRSGFGLEEDVVLIALRDGQGDPDALMTRLCDIGEPCATAVVDGCAIVLARETTPSRAHLDDHLRDQPAGVSGPASFQGLIRARHEAEAALSAAERSGGGLRHFAADVPRPVWLPTDSAVLREAVERVLGPLLRYESEHGVPLLASLRCYLEHDRRLADAAQVLYVHKRSLAYRLRRVEELTGRDLSSIDAVCDFWLALEADAALHPEVQAFGSRLHPNTESGD